MSWSIRIEGNQAFVYLKEKRLARSKKEYGALREAKESKRNDTPCILLIFVPDEHGTRSENRFPTNTVKRNLDKIELLTITSKRQRNDQQGLSAEERHKKRIEECRIDGQYHIPVHQINVPPKERLLRKVDELFLCRLKENMEKDPNGAYEPLYVNVKDFDPQKMECYEYEVLGGTHNLLAAKELFILNPERHEYSGRYAKIFVGLTDNEALWLATRHNLTGSFRHEMTFQDEVVVAREKLELMGKSDDNGSFSGGTDWRETCSQILGKTKKCLSDVFAMASLPQPGWENFLRICGKYEKGDLKDQRALPKDRKGKPTFRPSYVRHLVGLNNDDRLELLHKVAECEISLEEMKNVAVKLKAIRPVQKIICSFLGETSWEKIENKICDKVTPQHLQRFVGKDERNLLFNEYLNYLKKQVQGDSSPSIVIEPNTYSTNDGNKAILFNCGEAMNVTQGFCKDVQNGFALAIYNIPINTSGEAVVEVASRALVVVERLNFTIRSFFNVVLLGNVKQIFELSEWIKKTRGDAFSIAYYHIPGKKPSTGNTSPGMISSLQAYLVYHAAVGHKILPEHFNWHPSSSKEDLFIAEDEHDVQTQLVKLFSRDGDWVIDMKCFEANGSIAALHTKRNTVCLCGSDDHLFTAQQKIARFLQENDLENTESIGIQEKSTR